MTVKRWVPETEPLSAVVLSFALTLFTRLEMAPAPVLVKAEVKDEDGEKQSSPEPVLLASHAEVQGGRVVGGLLPPTTLSQVVQHVELLLALCYKSPELIDQFVIFLLSLCCLIHAVSMRRCYLLTMSHKQPL